ncbi:MAG TPA: ABC transporter permease subunit [Geomonas sp.]|nr:ABC transporter permease subunit [Geomonas sp.]
MRAVRIIAWRELRDALHSRWLAGFGILFALLTLGISYYGLAGSREAGFQGFGEVSASLLNLILFTVPMVAMVLPVTSLTSDEGLLILLTQPLGRGEVLLGKYLGMLGAVEGTLLGGLLLGGSVVMAQTGSDYLGNFLLLAALTSVLICLFLAFGVAIAVSWRDRSKALGMALGVWFVLVILYDLLVFGLTVSGPGISLKALLLLALAFNPVDAARVLYLLASGSSSFVGVTGAVLAETLGTAAGMAALIGLFVVQLSATLAAAGFIFRRKAF